MELKIVLIFEKEKISFLIQVRFVIVGIRFPIYQLNINTELWIAHSISRSGAYLVNRHLLGLFTGSVSGACSLFSKIKATLFTKWNCQAYEKNLNNFNQFTIIQSFKNVEPYLAASAAAACFLASAAATLLLPGTVRRYPIPISTRSASIFCSAMTSERPISWHLYRVDIGCPK